MVLVAGLVGLVGCGGDVTPRPLVSTSSDVLDGVVCGGLSGARLKEFIELRPGEEFTAVTADTRDKDHPVPVPAGADTGFSCRVKIDNGHPILTIIAWPPYSRPRTDEEIAKDDAKKGYTPLGKVGGFDVRYGLGEQFDVENPSSYVHGFKSKGYCGSYAVWVFHYRVPRGEDQLENLKRVWEYVAPLTGCPTAKTTPTPTTAATPAN